MEAQLDRPSHGHEDGGTHSVVEGGGEGEKRSVLKKVKDKAKKIKDTIKEHGHAHQHHDGQNDDEDDPEVHGAPIFESSVVRSIDLPRESNTNLEQDQGIKAKRNHLRDDEPQNIDTLPINHTNPKFQSPVEEDPHSPNNTLANPTPTATGTNKADVAPLVHKFDTLNVPQSEHNQFEKQQNSGSNPVSEPQFNPKTQDSTDTIAAKISSATCAVADKAISAKNAVASKLGYTQDSSDKPLASENQETQSMKEYLSEKLKPGEDDKALLEAITDALHKKKGAAQQQRGKVTVSKEVADRLGPVSENKREGEDALAAGEESSGEGVAERLQNAFSLWLRKSAGMQTAQDSVANAFVSDAGGGGPHHQ